MDKKNPLDNLRNIADDPRHLEYSALGGHNSRPTKVMQGTAKKIAASLAKTRLITGAVPPEVQAFLDGANKGKVDASNLQACMASLFVIAMSGGKGAVEANKLLLQILGEDVAEKQEVKIVYNNKEAADLMG